MRTLSPKKFVDIKRKQSFEPGIISHHTENDLHSENTNLIKQHNHDNIKTMPENSVIITNTTSENKFENVSDSSSEISDEGYRSLGISNLINNSQKRELNQALVKDDQSNGKKFILIKIYFNL